MYKTLVDSIDLVQFANERLITINKILAYFRYGICCQMFISHYKIINHRVDPKAKALNQKRQNRHHLSAPDRI